MTKEQIAAIEDFGRQRSNLKEAAYMIKLSLDEVNQVIHTLTKDCDHKYPDGGKAWKDSGGGALGFCICQICRICRRTDL